MSDEREVCFLLLQAQDLLDKHGDDLNPESLAVFREPSGCARLVAFDLEVKGHGKAAVNDAILGLTAGSSIELKIVARMAKSEDEGLKSMLEFVLWGPTAEELNEGTGKWLNGQRARLLNDILQTQGLRQVKLDFWDKMRLGFLVSVSEKSLCDANEAFQAKVAEIV